MEELGCDAKGGGALGAELEIDVQDSQEPRFSNQDACADEGTQARAISGQQTAMAAHHGDGTTA